MKNIENIEKGKFYLPTEFTHLNRGLTALYIVTKASNKKDTYIVEIYNKFGFIDRKYMKGTYIKKNFLIVETTDFHRHYYHQSYYDCFGRVSTQTHVKCVFCDSLPDSTALRHYKHHTRINTL